MKKQLLIPKNEQGFILPYVLFICMILFLNIFTSILLYENKIEEQKTMTEIIETKTLVQMTKRQFVLDSVDGLQSTGTNIYQYPNGKGHVKYNKVGDHTYKLEMNTYTNHGTKQFNQFYINLERELTN